MLVVEVISEGKVNMVDGTVLSVLEIGGNVGAVGGFCVAFVIGGSELGSTGEVVSETSVSEPSVVDSLKMSGVEASSLEVGVMLACEDDSGVLVVETR
ncbi:unnamed protein product, partial [Iphiclides podalirius]